MLFVVINVDLLAHPGAKPLLEMCEVDVTFTLRVQHSMHECNQFILSSLDFVASKMLFEVLVRDEAITVLVHPSELLVETRLGIESILFDLHHQVSESLGSCVVHLQVALLVAEFCVANCGRRVGPDSCVEDSVESNLISFVNQRRDLCDVGSAVIVEHKSRHEALNVLLGDFTRDQFMAALLDKVGLKVVHV